jgi:hypothetical protein
MRITQIGAGIRHTSPTQVPPVLYATAPFAVHLLAPL